MNFKRLLLFDFQNVFCMLFCSISPDCILMFLFKKIEMITHKTETIGYVSYTSSFIKVVLIYLIVYHTAKLEPHSDLRENVTFQNYYLIDFIHS